MCYLAQEAMLLSRQYRFAVTSINVNLSSWNHTSGTPIAPDEQGSPHPRRSPSREDASAFHTRLVLLGTAGGPIEVHRHGIASALVVNNTIYLVDCGEGVAHQMRQALGGERDGRGTFSSLRGIFLTHLHSDHVVDYNNILQFGWNDGLGKQTPVEIYGPGRRGSLPPIFGSGSPPIVNPENPTPGIVDMTNYLFQAYATDMNDRMRDAHFRDLRELVHVHDIVLPPDLVVDPNHDPAPPMRPFVIFQDENVRVSATLVNHGAVFPSLAYRFDTDDGSVCFSGDTSPCHNLIELAQGADTLVNEVIDAEWVQSLFPRPHGAREQALIEHLLTAHTDISEVGKIATEAGVKRLVLSHLIPPSNPPERWMMASKHYSGQLIVGEDLLQIGIGED